MYIAAPPAITAVEVNEICTNDFTVSWTPASNEEGLFYAVTLLQPGMMTAMILDSTMDTSYNFTGLTPNTAYIVSVASVLNSCLGTPNTIMHTTLTVEAGVPNSELTVMNCKPCCTCIIFESNSTCLIVFAVFAIKNLHYIILSCHIASKHTYIRTYIHTYILSIRKFSTTQP